MPRDLFGDVTRPSISIGNRKWYTVPVSLCSHSAIIVAVVAAPLLATPFLPKPSLRIGGVVIPVAPVPSPPPRLRPAQAKAITNSDAPPIEAPEGITPEKPVDFDTSFHDTDMASIVGGIDSIDRIIAPPPPPPAAPQHAVRPGGNIRVPEKVRHVAPTYPALAQSVGIQGVVIVEATIGVDGRVTNARVMRSIPLLDQAAIDAVRQWEFTPTLLNGVPVPVIMTVTVNFTLMR